MWLHLGRSLSIIYTEVLMSALQDLINALVVVVFVTAMAVARAVIMAPFLALLAWLEPRLLSFGLIAVGSWCMSIALIRVSNFYDGHGHL